MKYIKYFEQTEDEVARICNQYYIENWELRDGLVDVYGNVDLYGSGLTKLPLNFGYVSGYFYCNNNQLTTLEGCPNEVGGSFWCSDNQLTTLEGCPERVGGGFSCSRNNIFSLIGSPREIKSDLYCDNNKLTNLRGCSDIIGGSFYCYNNKLTTLEGGPKKVGGEFYCSWNKLTTLEFAPLKVSGNIFWNGNPLPPEILQIRYQRMRRLFLYFHHDYTLWKNGQFVKWKFEDLMDEINEYLEKHPEGIKFNI